MKKNNNQRENFEHKDEGVEGGGIGIGRKTNASKKKTNYTGFVIAAIVSLAILAALIF